jgi:hypothetical protein
MTCRHALSVLSFTLLLALSAGIASAQTPAGLPRITAATSPSFLKGAAVDGLGNVTLLFEHSTKHRTYGRRFSIAGTPLEPEFELRRAGLTQRVAANERGDTVILWDQPGSAGNPVWVRKFSPGQPPLTLPVNRRGDASFRIAGDVGIDRAGRFVAVWVELEGHFSRLHGQRFNADGTRLGPEISLGLPGFQALPRIAMSQATGDFVLLWTSSVNGRPGILGQRFGFTDGPRGEVFQVNSTDLGELFDFDAAGADDGSFAVVWTRYKSVPEPADILVEHFDAEGERSGGEVLAGSTVRFSGGVSLAMAPEGHFVVVWEAAANPDESFRSRLYHGDGTPAGPVREIPGTTNSFNPEVAFGWNGTFLLAWLGRHQIFAASPGEETCLFRQGHFLCDTDPGGGAEIDHVFAVRSGAPALGDVDDDGRDDYCLFRGTRFDCDSGHDNGAAEFTAFFGQPGDAPVIGDLDRDGRDEVCVFRAGTFLCDSGHNGGAAETTLAFGQPGDQPALRDVDGDGLDEACVLRGTAFLCDTGHDGGAAETTLTAAEAGPLLAGNLDGL